jgi:hypothetical protein
MVSLHEVSCEGYKIPGRSKRSSVSVKGVDGMFHWSQ